MSKLNPKRDKFNILFNQKDTNSELSNENSEELYKQQRRNEIINYISNFEQVAKLEYRGETKYSF